MGRQRSGGSSRPAPARAPPAPSRSSQTQTRTQTQSAPPPAPIQQNQPMHNQQQQQTQQGGGGGGGMLAGFGSMIMQGMAFGGGSAIAHRAVDAVAGPRTVSVEHKNSDQQQPNQMVPAGAGGGQEEMVCRDERFQFNTCLNDNRGDVGSCQFYFDLLNQCQKSGSDSKSSKWR